MKLASKEHNLFYFLLFVLFNVTISVLLVLFAFKSSELFSVQSIVPFLIVSIGSTIFINLFIKTKDKYLLIIYLVLAFLGAAFLVASAGFVNNAYVQTVAGLSLVVASLPFAFSSYKKSFQILIIKSLPFLFLIAGPIALLLYWSPRWSGFASLGTAIIYYQLFVTLIGFGMFLLVQSIIVFLNKKRKS